MPNADPTSAVTKLRGPRSILRVLANALLSLGIAAAASAQITPAVGPEIQVAATAAFQSAPAVAADAAGSAMIVVWQRQSPGASGDWDIYARPYKLDSTNQLVAAGTEFRVNTLTVGCQQYPAVAADAAGNFVVVWQSDQDPGGGTGIYTRRFSATATPLDAVEIRINTTATGNQARPAVARAPDGRYLVAWQSDSQSGGQGWDVVAQPFAANGSPVGGEILVNATIAGAQLSPRAAYLAAPTEGFVIVWESAAGIFVRRIAASGTAIDAAEQPVNTTSTGTQRNPALASDPSGNYVVAWESVDADGLTRRILARRFQGITALNNMTDLTLDPSPAAIQQRDPWVATDAVGNWVVAWDSFGEDGSGAAVVAAEFDRRQTPAGAKVVLDTLTAGDQTLPAIVLTQGGTLLAAWQSLTPAFDGAVVEARAATLAAGLFYTVTPCRLVDTRNPTGPLAGPALSPGVPRVFPLISLGGCGIPNTAKALSINLTAVNATSQGFLSLYPGDGTMPPSTNINYSTARSTIANNAQVLLSRDGAGTLAAVCGGTSPVHLIIDVNGYHPDPDHRAVLDRSARLRPRHSILWRARHGPGEVAGQQPESHDLRQWGARRLVRCVIEPCGNVRLWRIRDLRGSGQCLH